MMKSVSKNRRESKTRGGFMVSFSPFYDSSIRSFSIS